MNTFACLKDVCYNRDNRQNLSTSFTVSRIIRMLLASNNHVRILTYWFIWGLHSLLFCKEIVLRKNTTLIIKRLFNLVLTCFGPIYTSTSTPLIHIIFLFFLSFTLHSLCPLSIISTCHLLFCRHFHSILFNHCLKQQELDFLKTIIRQGIFKIINYDLIGKYGYLSFYSC